MSKKTIIQKIKEKLESLNVGEYLNRNNLIDEIYEGSNPHKDYFKRRAFDVHLCKAKKQSLMDFESNRDEIQRIS